MQSVIEKYKGIYPGMILERLLRKRNLDTTAFAVSLNELPQTIYDIIEGTSRLTLMLSIKIDKALELEEGTMLSLQAHYESETQRISMQKHPDLTIIRKVLFWDTDINKIDWERQYKSVIKRVFEKGNMEEKKEIFRFYGQRKVEEVLFA